MKLRYYVLLLLFCGAVIALTALRERTKHSVQVLPAVVLPDSLFKPLPEDSAAAARALAKLTKKLAQLQPKDVYIVVDTYTNFLEMRTQDSLLLRAPCSTGSQGTLVDSASGRQWDFRTPRGIFKVKHKLVQPWWRKPDWAFIEEGEPIPRRPEDRFDSEVLGDYALGFGDGYFIHGTLYTRLIGINVTHGCVRLADEDLKRVYQQARIGTPIYII